MNRGEFLDSFITDDDIARLCTEHSTCAAIRLNDVECTYGCTPKDLCPIHEAWASGFAAGMYEVIAEMGWVDGGR